MIMIMTPSRERQDVPVLHLCFVRKNAFQKIRNGKIPINFFSYAVLRHFQSTGCPVELTTDNQSGRVKTAG